MAAFISTAARTSNPTINIFYLFYFVVRGDEKGPGIADSGASNLRQ
jgi:hypothetical protein